MQLFNSEDTVHVCRFNKEDSLNSINRRACVYFWGSEDQVVVRLLNSTVTGGHWLNLGAGDGRYNNVIIKKADKVTAVDINISELNKIINNTIVAFYPKLSLCCCDLLQVFPFKASSLDGVFSSGTVHLFSPEKLIHIFDEVYDILNPCGKFVFSFTTNISRVNVKNNEKIYLTNEYSWKYQEAMNKIKNMINNKFYINKFEYRKQGPFVTTGYYNKTYKFKCHYILMSLIKH